jgi:hypothetical protein
MPQQLDGGKGVDLHLQDPAGARQAIAQALGGDAGKDQLGDGEERHHQRHRP